MYNPNPYKSIAFWIYVIFNATMITALVIGAVQFF